MRRKIPSPVACQASVVPVLEAAGCLQERPFPPLLRSDLELLPPLLRSVNQLLLLSELLPFSEAVSGRLRFQPPARGRGAALRPPRRTHEPRKHERQLRAFTGRLEPPRAAR